MASKKIDAETAEIMAKNFQAVAPMGHRLETIKILRAFARCKNVEPDGQQVFARHATELEIDVMKKIRKFLQS